MEMLSYGFMVRALAAGTLVGLACSALGVFLVLRRESLIGHGLADVAFGGIAAALLLAIDPVWGALAAALACALWIVRARRTGLSDDVSIGIVANAGLAIGVVLTSMSGGFTVGLLSYLFGDVLAITPVEVWSSAALAVLVLAAIARHYHDLVALVFDRDTAATAGVRVGYLETVLAVLAALTVVLAMKVVGVLLVSALIVMPAAAVLPFAPSFRSAVLLSMAVGTVSVAGGLAASYRLDVPAAGAVVLALLACFMFPRLLRLAGFLRLPQGE